MEVEVFVKDEGELIAIGTPSHKLLFTREAAIFADGGVELAAVTAIAVHEPEGVSCAEAIERVGGAEVDDMAVSDRGGEGGGPLGVAPDAGLGGEGEGEIAIGGEDPGVEVEGGGVVTNVLAGEEEAAIGGPREGGDPDPIGAGVVFGEALEDGAGEGGGGVIGILIRGGGLSGEGDEADFIGVAVGEGTAVWGPSVRATPPAISSGVGFDQLLGGDGEGGGGSEGAEPEVVIGFPAGEELGGEAGGVGDDGRGCGWVPIGPEDVVDAE